LIEDAAKGSLDSSSIRMRRAESGSAQAAKRCWRKCAFCQLRSTFREEGIQFYCSQDLEIYMEGVRELNR
jgi:hypothetical protein